MKNWQFNNHWHDELKGTYTRVNPDPIKHPVLVAYSQSTGELLDLSESPGSEELCQFFSGQRPLPGSQPLAQIYAGHQFGQYVPQLGDGRALLLGQLQTKSNQSWDLHLKGAGQTPYSRQGDGRAVLRSSIREFLASEAMHALDIPTSRALCVIGSDTPVVREQMESAATLLRVAKSHLRFGHFEYFFYQNRHDKLKELADYAISHHFQDCIQHEQPYQALLQAVVVRTARLIAKWQAVGFTHGVMNTDNMSLLGLTLDYGPFGFMDAYQTNHIPNHSDYSGRYAYIQQPGIGYWNLQCLAHAFSPLVPVEQARQALDYYQVTLLGHYSELMAAKFGLDEVRDGDGPLLNEFMQLLEKGGQDHTRSFRALTWQDVNSTTSDLENDFVDRDGFREWWLRYRTRRLKQGEVERWQQRMLKANPHYILRNHLAQIAIERAEKGDFSELARLQCVLQNPYDEEPKYDAYADLPPPWSQELEISCSS